MDRIQREVWQTLKDEGQLGLETFETPESDGYILALRVGDSRYRQGFNSFKEMTDFYRQNLKTYLNPGTAVYGSSDTAVQEVVEKDTWGVARDSEWAVDVEKILEKHVDADVDRQMYREALENISASTLATVSFSREGREEKRPEGYGFYQEIIEDLEVEEEKGLIQRVADLEQDSRSYVRMAREEGARDAAKRKGKKYAVSKAEERAEEELEERGFMQYLDRVEEVNDKIERFQRQVEREMRKQDFPEQDQDIREIAEKVKQDIENELQDMKNEGRKLAGRLEQESERLKERWRRRK